MADVFDEVYGETSSIASTSMAVSSYPSSVTADPFDEVYGTAEIDPSPTWGQSAKYIGRNLVAGAGNLLTMGVQALPGNTELMMPESQRPSTAFKNLLTNIFGEETPEYSGLVPNTPTKVIGAMAQGAVFPEAPVVNALASGGAKLGEILDPENPLAPILGAVGGAGLAGTVKSIANTAQTTGKAFERSSLGATSKNYVKSLKTNGLIDDVEAGELSTKLSKAINEIGDTEGWGLLRDPERLALRNQSVLDDVGTKIGTTLELASTTGIKPVVDFTGKNSAVSKLIQNAKAEKKQIKEAFDEFLDTFTDPVDGWSGDLASLNQWKSSIQNQAFSGSAKGSLAAPVQRKLQRAIANDLKSAVDKGVVESGVVSADDWKRTLDLFGRHAEVAPILNEGVAKGLGGTLDQTARALLRTSGGTLTTPTVIGATVGGATGGPIGLALGAGLGALGSPTGQGIAGSLLKTGGRAIGSLTGGNKKIAAITGLLNNVLSNSKESEIKIEPELKQQLKKVLGDTDLTTRSEAMARSPEFDAKVNDIALELDTDPEYLMKAMAFETGGTFSATEKNRAGSGATGLIQFMPKTAKALLKTDTEDEAIKMLESMTEVEQLDLVKEYLKPYKGKLNSIQDVYMAILYPKAIGKADEYALFNAGTTAYKQNKGLDSDRDGVVTKEEAARKVKNYDVADSSILDFAKKKSSDFLTAMDQPNLIPTLLGGEPGPSLKTRAGQAIELAANLSPGLGDALSVKDAISEFKDGNYGSASLSALAAIPMLGMVGDAAKVGKKAIKGADVALDMSKTAREARAAEMGFLPETFYHGTADNFDSFDKELLGTVTKHPTSKEGIYLTDNASEAEYYANWAKGEKKYRDALGEVVDEKSSANLIPSKVKIENPLAVDIGSDDVINKLDSLKYWIDEAKRDGHDGLIIFSESPDYGLRKWAVPFDSKQIRSIFAKFDPSKKESSDILASATGLAFLAAVMGGKDNQ